MTYQIAKKSQLQTLLGETKSAICNIKPTQDARFEHLVITVYLRGHLASDFKMRVNVYKDRSGNSLMMSSTPVNNLDIVRTGDYYCELRFDFPRAGNVLAIGVEHLVEFEVYDGYTYSQDNFLGLIMGPHGGFGFSGSDVILPSETNQLAHRFSPFLAIVEEQSDEKFYMVKMDGAKILGRDCTRSFPTAGGILYSATIQSGLWFDPTDDEAVCFFNGTVFDDLTRVFEPFEDGVTPEDSWYYDQVSGEFFAYGNASLSFGNGYNIHLRYSIFFTEYIGRYADPKMASGTARVYWQPRLLPGLEFGYNQQNAFAGILSITSSSISLKNQDRYFHSFFGPEDSFSNRQVKVWRCDGDVTNKTLEFVGTIRGAGFNDQTCTIDIQDGLATLDSTYDDGRPLTWDQMNYASGLIRTEDLQLPVFRSMGIRGPYEFEYYDPTGVADFRQLPAINGEKMVQAINVSRNATLSTSVNRTWSLGFGPTSVTDKTFDCTVAAQLLLGTYSASILTLDVSGLGDKTAQDFFAVGDSIKNGTQYGIVYEVTSNQLYIWPYNAAFSAANNVERKKVSALVIRKGDVLFYPIAGRDYSVSLGSDGDVKITFVNNFEATFSGLGTLDPDGVEIFGRVYNDDGDARASEVLRSVMDMVDSITTSSDWAPAQQTGRPSNTNEGAMSGAQSYPDPFLSFSIPFAGQSNFPTYRELADKILKSVMGFVYFDELGEMRYKTFLDRNWNDFPGLQFEGERTEDFIDNQSGFTPSQLAIDETKSIGVTVQMDLFDAFSGVEFNLSHNPMVNFTPKYSIAGARRLYNTNKNYQLECLVDAASSDFSKFATRLVCQVAGRKASYTLTSFASSFVYLGDDILVTRARIVGSSGESFMRVVAISKANISQKLTMLDMARYRGTTFPVATY